MRWSEISGALGIVWVFVQLIFVLIGLWIGWTKTLPKSRIPDTSGDEAQAWFRIYWSCPGLTNPNLTKCSVEQCATSTLSTLLRIVKVSHYPLFVTVSANVTVVNSISVSIIVSQICHNKRFVTTSVVTITCGSTITGWPIRPERLHLKSQEATSEAIRYFLLYIKLILAWLGDLLAQAGLWCAIISRGWVCCPLHACTVWCWIELQFAGLRISRT